MSNLGRGLGWGESWSLSRFRERSVVGRRIVHSLWEGVRGESDMDVSSEGRIVEQEAGGPVPPRPVLRRLTGRLFRWPRTWRGVWVLGLMGIVLTVGGVWLRGWHERVVLAGVAGRGGTIDRVLTPYQHWLDRVYMEWTRELPPANPDRGLIRGVMLIHPTEMELWVLGRHSTLEWLWIQGEELSPGMLRLIARQPGLRSLSLSVRGMGDEELLRVMEGLHASARLESLAIHAETEVTDEGLNRVLALGRVEKSLNLEGSAVTGERVRFPRRSAGAVGPLNLSLGKNRVSDGTLERMLQEAVSVETGVWVRKVQFQYLELRSPGVTFAELKRLAESQTSGLLGVRILDVWEMGLSSEEIQELGVLLPRVKIEPNLGEELRNGG